MSVYGSKDGNGNFSSHLVEPARRSVDVSGTIVEM